jgi:hypothetical protein
MAITSNTSYKVNRNHLNNSTSLLVDEILVAAGDLNTTTDLSLVGKDTIGYGTAIAQNSVKLLENFASDTAPTKPTEGQLWWDTGSTVTTADIDYNHNKALKIWHIVTPGAAGTAGGEWITLHSITEGSLDGVVLIDDQGGKHTVRVVTVGTTIISITSKDAAFNINQTEATMATYRAAFSNSGAGTGAATVSPGSRLAAIGSFTYYGARAQTIYGGSNEIQKKIIAKRVLK